MRTKEFILYYFLGKAKYSELSEMEVEVHNENSTFLAHVKKILFFIWKKIGAISK